MPTTATHARTIVKAEVSAARVNKTAIATAIAVAAAATATLRRAGAANFV